MTQPETRKYRFEIRDRQAIDKARAAAEARGYTTLPPKHSLATSRLAVRGWEPERLDALMAGFGAEPILREDNA